MTQFWMVNFGKEDFGSLGKELIKQRGRTNMGSEHGYGWPLHFPLGITDK